MTTDNGERQARGAAAVDAYVLAHDLAGEPWETSAVDLVADVLHAIAARDLDADGLLGVAARHYREEAT